MTPEQKRAIEALSDEIAGFPITWDLMYGFASALIPTAVHSRRNDFPDFIELTLVTFDRYGKEMDRRQTSYRADDRVERLVWERHNYRFRTCAICYRPAKVGQGHICNWCLMGTTDPDEEAEREHINRLRNTGPAGSPDQSWVLCREDVGLTVYDHGIRINLTPWPKVKP